MSPILAQCMARRHGGRYDRSKDNTPGNYLMVKVSDSLVCHGPTGPIVKLYNLICLGNKCETGLGVNNDGNSFFANRKER